MNIVKKAGAFLLGGALFCGMLPMMTAAAKSEVETYTDTPIDPSLSFLVDDAQVLTSEEEEELMEDICDTAEYIDMNIGIFVSGTYTPRDDTQMYCERICADAFGLGDDSVVLYLDLSGQDDLSYSPYDFFYTRNRARFYYTDGACGDSNRVQEVFSEMNPYLPRGDEDVVSALDEFLYELEYYYDYGPDLDYYFYIADTDKYVTMDENNILTHQDSLPKDWGHIIRIALFISLIVTLITFFFIKRHYRFKSAPSSLEYLNFNETKLGPKSDVYLRRYTTRHKIERSSSGGGGGGGGTSSGGGGGGNSR